MSSIKLAVFNEFSAPEALAAVRQLPLTVDQADTPSKLATTDAEKQVVATNAKLMFPASTSSEEVDSTLAKLAPIGFKVVHRTPVTSAGFPMNDRVILAFSP